MCLAFRARESTRDVDATFEPSVAVLEAAHRVAAREGVPDHWLNDAVKTYLSDQGEYEDLLERSHLRVFSANAKYMLAMKCMAMRIGEGYHDEADIRFLLRHLGLETIETARTILAKYYPLDAYPKRALAAVQEILSSNHRS